MYSIIFFKTACTLLRVFAIATNMQSSTKPVDNSNMPVSMSMRSACKMLIVAWRVGNPELCYW